MQQNLNFHSATNSIRLQLNHPQGRHYVWVLVEGITDQKLYNKLLDGQNTKVEMVHGGGKNSLRQAVGELIAITDRVIGIRDADFLHLEQQQETLSVLFLTDTHDAEMLLLASDTALQQVLAEYCPDKFNEFSDFRENILRSLTFLSGMRWLNDSEDLGLSFKDVGWPVIYCPDTYTLDKNACLNKIAQCSPYKTRSLSVAEVEQKTAEITDYYNLCNGHDVLKAMALCITALNPKLKNLKHDALPANLRIAYRQADFAQTILYQNLKNWESSSGYSLFSV